MVPEVKESHSRFWKSHSRNGSRNGSRTDFSGPGVRIGNDFFSHSRFSLPIPIPIFWLKVTPDLSEKSGVTQKWNFKHWQCAKFWFPIGIRNHFGNNFYMVVPDLSFPNREPQFSLVFEVFKVNPNFLKVASEIVPNFDFLGSESRIRIDFLNFKSMVPVPIPIPIFLLKAW